jgi:ethanolamine permease
VVQPLQHPSFATQIRARLSQFFSTKIELSPGRGSFMQTTKVTPVLKRTLGSFKLWGIAVGLVISGEYFGWSYGWAQAGTLGFLITALVIAAMYCAFIFSFTELTTSIPHAGGPFAYAYRAFGPTGGFVAGFATLVEFVFAPPAIAMAIGAYLNVQFPSIEPKWVAVGAYLVFMALNILGVSIAATFELLVTLLAIFELLVFMGVVAPGFEMSNFVHGGWAGSDTFSPAAFSGIFAAIPFAIWFFLAIEGASMAAEEAKDPQRTIPKAFIGGILTLTVLALGVMLFAGGVGDWTKLSNINDPLPQAMKLIAGLAGAFWPDCLFPRHYHGVFPSDLRAGPGRLFA